MRNGYRLWLLVMLGICALIVVGMLAGTCVPSYAQEPIVVTIKDFGQSMVTVTGPYTNNPEAIALSENMYSTQPGGRQLRYGYTGMMKAKSSASSIKSLVHYAPKNDSASIIHTAAGIWWDTKTGGYSYGSGGPSDPFVWVTDTLAAGTRIRPFKAGDSIKAVGTSIKGYGTRFVRDLQPGDTITFETGAADTTRKIKTVIADDSLELVSAAGTADSFFTTTEYTVSRTYASAQTPFLLQSGEHVYTGTVADPPQIIYNVSSTSNDTRYIRSMGIVDSFFVDSIYSNYNDTLTRRSWDTLTNGKKMIKEIQIVSRRKTWFPNQWIEDVNGNPQAYYVRLGHSGGALKHKSKFYAIEGNSDTSIYLRTWYVDSLIAGTKMWQDSVFQDSAGQWTPSLSDTLTAADIEGTWGYIYSACGNVKTVLADANTNTATLLARGSVWILTGVDALTISPDSFYQNLYFLHLTGDDVSFPQFSTTSRVATYTKDVIWYPCVTGPPDVGTLPVGDTVIAVIDRCLDNPGEPIICGRCGIARRVWTIQTSAQITVAADFTSTASGWYPIRYAVLDTVGTDTLAIVTGPSPALNDTTNVTTANWELVKVGLPYWSGMVEWNTPPQLVAWGDSLSASLLSFSHGDDRWNWSVTGDILVGENSQDLVVGCFGYNDELVVGKQNSGLTYDGQTFRELAKSLGLVGPKAIYGRDKEFYWMSHDGVYRTQRRDFSGYSNEKISAALDPIFNAWSTGTYMTDEVPFKINPAKRHLSVMTYNQRDGHLYLFVCVDTNQVPRHCLTYNVQTNAWDGYFNIKANDAIVAVVRDTTRILFGSPDSAYIFGLDYVYNDAGTGISATLKSHRFWLTDKDGWPVEAQLMRVHFLGRGSTAFYDTCNLYIDGSAAGDEYTAASHTVPLVLALGAAADDDDMFYIQDGPIATYWNWRFRFVGKAAGSIFKPRLLQLEFLPLRRDDS